MHIQVEICKPVFCPATSMAIQAIQVQVDENQVGSDSQVTNHINLKSHIQEYIETPPVSRDIGTYVSTRSLQALSSLF